MTREISATGSNAEKKRILYTITKTYIECLKLMSPITPFITEQIWQTLKQELNLKEESVHLCGWPKAEEKWINEKLEEQFDVIANIIQITLAGREKAKIGLRWPIKEIKIITEKKDVEKAVTELNEIIKRMTNVKEVNLGIGKGKKYVDIEFKHGKIQINTEINDELLAEGYYREITRRIQALRKKSGLQKQDRIKLFLKTDSSLKKMLSEWTENIKEKVGANIVDVSCEDSSEKYKYSSEEKIKEKEIKILFNQN